jgi:acetyl-CoA C-acetyltransferase
MERALVVDGLRTPHGRYGGALKDVSMTTLAVRVATALLERTGLDPAAVDELILSCRHQAGNGPNPGRTVAVKSGLGERTPAHTINMACASGLKAVWLARQAIQAGDSSVVLVVAADSMSTMPYYGSYKLRWGGAKPHDITLIDGWRDGEDPLSGLSMGLTAENVARRYEITREDQDAWAYRSHHRAATAWENGAFASEVIAVQDDAGALAADETIRAQTTLAKLASLRPAFDKAGTVTAGNASQMADAASAVLVVSDEAARKWGLTPAASIRAAAAVGVDPSYMGIGPVEAIPKALGLAGLATSDIDLFEINEAFAAQIVQNVRGLDLDADRVNQDGGGISLGHPTGETGGRLISTCLRQLKSRDANLGVASLCVGGGQGVAIVLERES